jgi:hypothetical protein
MDSNNGSQARSLQSNPENTVGVLTMAGKGVRVLVTPTPDLGKILSCMHGMLVKLPFVYGSKFDKAPRL